MMQQRIALIKKSNEQRTEGNQLESSSALKENIEHLKS